MPYGLSLSLSQGAVHKVRHARGGGVTAQCYEALHGGGGYLADRYVTLIFNFICLVFSLSTERLVQLRRVPIMHYE